MSSALRLRETVALQRLGNALGVGLDPDKVNAVLLEELADAAEQAKLGAGHPFHVLLPSGIVFRGRIGDLCMAELSVNGITPLAVETEIQAALDFVSDNGGHTNDPEAAG